MKKIMLFVCLVVLMSTPAYANRYASLDCDWSWNLTDVILIKKADALFLPNVDRCDDLRKNGNGERINVYVAGCDADNDGNCTLLDAVIVQQCNALIENPYCEFLREDHMENYVTALSAMDSSLFTTIESSRPLAAFSPSSRQNYYSEPHAMMLEDGRVYDAVLDTTLGEMRIRLFADVAPVAVNNFVQLSLDGYYDGITFHRVINNFMVQSGAPISTGFGGPGYTFDGEYDSFTYFDRRGLLAMANNGPNNNGSQFFITHKPTDWLTMSHPIFGYLIAGDDVLDSIPVTTSGVAENGADVAVINSIQIEIK